MLIDFVDRSFDLRRISYYRLSIQLSLSGFSFCIVDISTNKNVVLREYRYKKNVSNYNMLHAEVSAIILSEPLLQSDYAVCDCVFVTQYYTFIPRSFFVEQILRSYLAFIHPVDELDEIHFTKLESIDGYSIFPIPSPLASLLRDQYTKVNFVGQATLALCASQLKKEEYVVSINFHHNFVDITVLRYNELLLSNAYDVVGITDVIYYLSSIIRKLNLPQEAGIYLSGEFDKKEVEQLTAYYPFTRVDHHEDLFLSTEYEQSYRYYNLLMLKQCESLVGV